MVTGECNESSLANCYTLEREEIMKFKVGDILRNKNPYNGECTKLVIGVDNDEYLVQRCAGKLGLSEIDRRKL